MPAERSVAIDEYWQHGNPLYCDDDKSESFLNFIHRVEAFHQALLNQHGFLVIFGHDQFFNAFLYGYQHGFFVTSEWMHLFRQSETAKPMLNGEIIHLELSH